jgi:patatin-like phospholipase/acyl hydrolase
MDDLLKIFGTSTGGIIALGIGAGKTTKQLMCLYFRLKNTVFSGMVPYDNALEVFLKEEFGEDAVSDKWGYQNLLNGNFTGHSLLLNFCQF